MHNIVIFGNSGSGKSTLAHRISKQHSIAHLDLDTIAWMPTNPPSRRTLESSNKRIQAFTDTSKNWVIEGCYSDLLALVIPAASKLVFLDLPISACIENAKKRTWEPHKYESKEAQDNNLDMLINWIGEYERRTDTFSHEAHTKLFNQFDGPKVRYSCNEDCAVI